MVNSPSISACVFATLLSTSIVGNTLSHMLHMAGTTFGSRSLLFNSQWSLSPFHSLPLEAALSDMHRVTDSVYSYWVWPFSAPSGLVLLLGYCYHPPTWLAPDCPFTLPRRLHSGSPQLPSLVVLHCLNAGYAHLCFLINVLNGCVVFCGPNLPHCSFHHCRYFGFHWLL